MCCDDEGEAGEVEGAELGTVGGGTEARRRNSERFLRISSMEAALEGLEKDGFTGFEGFDAFAGFLGENGEVALCCRCCCCLRLALTSEK